MKETKETKSKEIFKILMKGINELEEQNDKLRKEKKELIDFIKEKSLSDVTDLQKKEATEKLNFSFALKNYLKEKGYI